MTTPLSMALQVRDGLEEISCQGRYRAVGDPGLPAKFSAAVGLARELRRTADELVEALGWRPIESAPKNGTKIIAFAVDIYAKDRSEMHTTFWNNGRWAWFSTHYPPTHWMPLPLPPQKQGE